MELAWYLVLGGLFAGYFVLGGYDYGVGMSLPLLARGDADRRRALNAIGPFFLGNEVWIVATVGVLLAAFPRVEGELFTGTYPLLVPVVLALVAVNAAVQLRSHPRSRTARRAFDVLIVWPSLLLAVGWGMLLGNLLTGLPVDASGHVRGFGSLFGWYPWLAGLAVAGLFALHGATFLAMRAVGPVRERARALAGRLVLPAAVLVTAALAGAYLSARVRAGIGNPVAGTILAAAVVAAVLLAGAALRSGRPGRAFAATAVAVALPVLAVGAARYPYALVSTVDPAASLTVPDGAAGTAALRQLSLFAGPVLPVLLGVQALSWWVFGRRGAPRTVYW